MTSQKERHIARIHKTSVYVIGENYMTGQINCCWISPFVVTLILVFCSSLAPASSLGGESSYSTAAKRARTNHREMFMMILFMSSKRTQDQKHSREALSKKPSFPSQRFHRLARFIRPFDSFNSFVGERGKEPASQAFPSSSFLGSSLLCRV